MGSPTTVDTPPVEWLLEGDPAVQWQVQRDLLDESVDAWRPTRSEVGRSGWGRALLDRQDTDGRWASGWYSPKWTSTTYTLLLLARFGLTDDISGAQAGCRRLLDDARWVDGGISYWKSHRYPELCVNAMVVSVCAAFEFDDDRTDQLARLLIDRRLADGAWNCLAETGATHSSFHTTISALEALDRWAVFRSTDEADGAITSGIEFMLDHRLYRSHRTGQVIDSDWLVPHFPPRWHYDTLRGLDFLRHRGHPPDDRMGDAIAELVRRRRADGRWGKGPQYSGDVFFPLEPGRVPGRMNTLRALRVLRWWEGR